MLSRDVCVVVGAQFGSEGKGAVVADIAGQYRHHVRVGAANAGHTLYTFDWQGQPEKHVMQQIPCAAYANPSAELYIGPGALISADILLEEIRLLDLWRMDRSLDSKVIHIDRRAHIITQGQVEREFSGDLAKRIGSTSATAAEGIGTAQADRAMREDWCVTADKYFIGKRWDCVNLTDVPRRLAKAEGGILLEGTQGTGLSLTTGFFPFVTSRNTTSAGIAADCGIAPTRIGRVIGVARSHPIRVAGNSGPFYPDSLEESWDDLGIDPENERTTVTKKIRRVAQLSTQQLIDTVELNGVTEWAFMFADYMDPAIAGVAGAHDPQGMADACPDLVDYIAGIYTDTGVPVTMIGTGPHSMIHWDFA